MKRSNAERRAWKAMSDYIRERDNWTCFTCGNVAYGGTMHAGHLFPRTKRILKYDYRNVHAQCCTCNTFNEGETLVYQRRFIEKYGKKLYDYFYSRRNLAKKRSIEELLEIEKFYKNKLKSLGDKGSTEELRIKSELSAIERDVDIDCNRVKNINKVKSKIKTRIKSNKDKLKELKDEKKIL